MPSRTEPAHTWATSSPPLLAPTPLRLRVRPTHSPPGPSLLPTPIGLSPRTPSPRARLSSSLQPHSDPRVRLPSSLPTPIGQSTRSPGPRAHLPSSLPAPLGLSLRNPGPQARRPSSLGVAPYPTPTHALASHPRFLPIGLSPRTPGIWNLGSCDITVLGMIS